MAYCKPLMATIRTLVRCSVITCALASCANTGTSSQRAATPAPIVCELRYVASVVPEKGSVVYAMRTVAPRVRDCFDRFRQPGMFLACLDVASAGTVEHVASQGDLTGTAEARCIEEELKSVKFPVNSTPWSLQYPYILR